MRVVPVPVLSDNYAYLLINDQKEACAVDPADAAKVLEAAQQEGVTITKVLTTHKHSDHAGGNDQMAQLVPGVEIVGGALDSVAACTAPVNHGDTVAFTGMTIKCIHTPGHTVGHICYHVTERGQGDEGCVFTGDVLFVGGAGKFFEGTSADMELSLYMRLACLPPRTRVWCGHEYTLSNYEFALAVDAGNAELAAAAAEAQRQRRDGAPTVPSTIGRELATNPFMRAHTAAVRAAVGAGRGDGVAATLQRVRDAKDRF
ncbi:beta-lactamase-like protein [Tribonema minus]|uniref:hydroxyacylglutathione hydrolase n=1 Tax=Tribonema minus TaxID=303371 RepID=A0A836CGL4_9STRA|nr:beta-lactamase-like protein [Tribonema minus]